MMKRLVFGNGEYVLYRGLPDPDNEYDDDCLWHLDHVPTDSTVLVSESALVLARIAKRLPPVGPTEMRVNAYGRRYAVLPDRLATARAMVAVIDACGARERVRFWTGYPMSVERFISRLEELVARERDWHD